jgi:hypothetical protein
MAAANVAPYLSSNDRFKEIASKLHDDFFPNLQQTDRLTIRLKERITHNPVVTYLADTEVLKRYTTKSNTSEEGKK